MPPQQHVTKPTRRTLATKAGTFGEPATAHAFTTVRLFRTDVLNSWRETVVDLRDAVAYHQLVLNADGRSARTQQHYFYFQRKFLEYLELRQIKPTLAALSVANVHAATTWYREQPHPNRTRNGEVGAQVFVSILKTWANKLEEDGIYEDSPLRKVRRVSITKRVREPFSRTDINALWNACRQSQNPQRDEALFLVLLDTGMRNAEACSLTLETLNLEERYAIIMGKGRRERRVPLGDPQKRDGGRTIRALRTYHASRKQSSRAGNAVFLGRDGYPLQTSGVWDMVSRAGTLSGVPNAHPHRLRHTFATHYLTEFPGDELGLRRIIGHVSKAVLADYVHFAQSTIADRAGRASMADMLLDTTPLTLPRVRAR